VERSDDLGLCVDQVEGHVSRVDMVHLERKSVEHSEKSSNRSLVVGVNQGKDGGCELDQDSVFLGVDEISELCNSCGVEFSLLLLQLRFKISGNF